MKVLFVGPLPPPVHGFALINAAMLSALQEKASIVVFDRKPPNSNSISKFLEWAGLVRRFVSAIRNPACCLYIGLSGGKGQVLDLPFILFSRLAALPIYIHHHSFAYLNKYSPLTALVLRAAGKPHHIVLGRKMASTLTAQYGIPQNCISLISNAAFQITNNSIRASSIHSNTAKGNSPVVGYISNITAEKGIFDLFRSLDHLRRSGVDFRARIAGPVDKSIFYEFHREIANRPDIEYIGAVYGEEKSLFFRSLDVLVFPTRYVNEAEPVTIHEALAAGTYVVAADRGCIPEMIPSDCGRVVEVEEVAATLLEVILTMNRDSDLKQTTRREYIQKEFSKMQAIHVKALEQIVHSITSNRE